MALAHRRREEHDGGVLVYNNPSFPPAVPLALISDLAINPSRFCLYLSHRIVPDLDLAQALCADSGHKIDLGTRSPLVALSIPIALLVTVSI
ncbi:hypothetical protein EVAR_233_1 [Eumeta japonica]|uniref:Uncharacterized protein n=1 Tax=Eumeta variegata TaxID=151549 RepID=A0A4C1S997_EUMVA|nr:hypothetical protein EVAR_233_1 [Eumeta japonica]